MNNAIRKATANQLDCIESFPREAGYAVVAAGGADLRKLANRAAKWYPYEDTTLRQTIRGGEAPQPSCVVDH